VRPLSSFRVNGLIKPFPTLDLRGLTVRISNDAGKKGKLTVAQASQLSAAVTQIEAELGLWIGARPEPDGGSARADG